MKIKGISNFCQGPGQVQVRMRGLEKDYGGGLGGGLEGVLGGGLGGVLGVGLQRGLQRGIQTGYGRGLAVKLRSGKIQVRFSLQPKFNSVELDSEVGRLVHNSIHDMTNNIIHDMLYDRICVMIYEMIHDYSTPLHHVLNKYFHTVPL